MSEQSAEDDATPRCEGSSRCSAPRHVHGCYADVDGSACDDPGEHAGTHYGNCASHISSSCDCVELWRPEKPLIPPASTPEKRGASDG